MKSVMKINMKFIVLLIVLLSTGAFMLIRALNGAEEHLTFRGVVLYAEKNDQITLLVDGQFKSNASNLSTTVTQFTLKEGGGITKDGVAMDFNSLKRGTFLELTSSSELRTSYPAQGDAYEIRILEPQELPLIMEGEILEVAAGQRTNVATVHIKGFLSGYGESTEIRVDIPEDSYYPFGLNENINLLHKADRVFMVLRGGVRESYPLQGTSSSLIILPLQAN